MENNDILDNLIFPSDSLSATINELELRGYLLFFNCCCGFGRNIAERVISTELQ